MIGQHYYPGGDGPNVKDIVKARDDMLSPAWHPKYQAFYDLFVPAVLKNGLKFRMNEGSSFSKGGALGASDTYSASLWILDYLYWWAHHSASGLNFHTGEKVLPGTVGPDKPNVYTSLTSSEKGYTILPPGYGIKMFELGGHGDLLPVEVEKNKGKVNLVAYGVKGPKGEVTLTLINREYGSEGREAVVSIDVGREVEKVQFVEMRQREGDIGQVGGVTVGGEEIGENGKWAGGWKDLAEGVSKTKVTVGVASASATVLRFVIK